jgi:hypothetical protein
MTNASASLDLHPEFNVNGKTMIYSHGFNGNPNQTDLLELGTNLVGQGYNFLTLDSRVFLDGVDYAYVSGTVPYIGHLLYQFISQLYAKGLDPTKLHLLGHSLGAQISGYAAREFKKTKNVTISRITAMDPASPCFFNTDLTSLSPTDADYVDAIFTSILSYRNDGTSVGKAQYYINSRHGMQPGCPTTIGLDLRCSHSRSKALFIESVGNQLGFPAKRCQDINVYNCNPFDFSYMGLASSSTSSGNYFLTTNDVSPFSKGLLGLI